MSGIDFYGRPSGYFPGWAGPECPTIFVKVTQSELRHRTSIRFDSGIVRWWSITTACGHIVGETRSVRYTKATTVRSSRRHGVSERHIRAAPRRVRCGACETAEWLRLTTEWRKTL